MPQQRASPPNPYAIPNYEVVLLLHSKKCLREPTYTSIVGVRHMTGENAFRVNIKPHAKYNVTFGDYVTARVAEKGQLNYLGLPVQPKVISEKTVIGLPKLEIEDGMCGECQIGCGIKGTFILCRRMFSYGSHESHTSRKY